MSLGSNHRRQICLYFYSKGAIHIFILIYVDDLTVASSTKDATIVLLQDLNKEFALKDLGDLHYFLRIEVSRVRDGIILAQEKYANVVLQRVGMVNCNSVSTPLSISEKLLTNEGAPLGPNDATNYRSVVVPCSI
jgi:histone deacetylase 1/2